MNTMTRSVLLAFAASAMVPMTVLAQDARNQGYLTDTNGNIVTSANTGLCTRDSDWTQARSVEPCDPNFKPTAAAIAPPQRASAAIAPPPAPVQLAVAPRAATPVIAPLSERISFSADALFAFDKSDLKPEGRAMLDDLVSKSSGATYEHIIATGHADRFGSPDYNQKLSERRAHAVKDYLVSRNIQAGRIDAAGKGESQPMTKAEDCKGPKSVKVVACLQPDRRVDVEMTGTKTVASSR